MGTRNLTLVQSDGEYKVGQYCQWDGYPSGQGITILAALRNIDVADFKRKVDSLKQLTEDEVQELWKKCGADGSGWVDLEVSDKFKKRYKQLHRDFGGRIIEAVANGDVKKVYADCDFAANSLFCEWAYVVDLDKNTFEVYQGFNKSPLADDERFKFLEPKSSDGYYPVKLLASWPLDALPADDELLALECCDDEEEDEAEDEAESATETSA